MTITERLFVTLAQKKITQKDFAKQIGVNEKTVSAWKKNNSLPPLDKISNISDCLDVSIDYLITGKEKCSPAKLNADEQELLTYYKSLTEREKGIVLGRAEVLSELHKTPMKETKNTIFIEYYSLPVSAGTGVYLDGCEKDMLEVEETVLTNEANFALRVSGNSMEPVYHDGDMVLIASQPTVEVGEIGIFIVNGEGYVKKFGGDKLISLNPDYDDIMLNEDDSFYCKGKVIGVL